MTSSRAATRRRRRRRRLLLAAAVVGTSLAVGGSLWFVRPDGRVRAFQGRALDARVPDARVGSRSPGPPLGTRAPEPATATFATAGGLDLWVPAADPVAIAYHQASYPDALPMQPRGHMQRNHNRTMFEDPGPTAGPAYLIQAARGRSTEATSAVDIVVREGDAVLAPVTGTVARVKRYELYGRYRDVRVEIRPAAATDLRVVVIHLDRVEVRRGDQVFAARSPLGIARSFPFRSAVDTYVTGDHPHVHLEVKDAASDASHG